MCPEMQVYPSADQAELRRRWAVRAVDAELHARLATFALLWPFALAAGAAVMALLRMPGLTSTRF